VCPGASLIAPEPIKGLRISMGGVGRGKSYLDGWCFLTVLPFDKKIAVPLSFVYGSRVHHELRTRWKQQKKSFGSWWPKTIAQELGSFVLKLSSLVSDIGRHDILGGLFALI